MGDLFTMPFMGEIQHQASDDTAFYWVNDQPLMDFLGVRPTKKRFRPLFFSGEQLNEELERSGVPTRARTRTATASCWPIPTAHRPRR